MVAAVTEKTRGFTDIVTSLHLFNDLQEVEHHLSLEEIQKAEVIWMKEVQVE